MVRAFVAAMLLAIIGAAAVQAQTPSEGGRFYSIELRLEDGDRLVGTPRMILREGAPAIMTVKGANGYSLRATLTASNDRGRTRVNVSTEIYLARNDKWKLRGSPWISAPLGEQATIEVAAGANGAKPLKVTFRATEGTRPTGSVGPAGQWQPCGPDSESAWRRSLGESASAPKHALERDDIKLNPFVSSEVKKPPRSVQPRFSTSLETNGIGGGSI